MRNTGLPAKQRTHADELVHGKVELRDRNGRRQRRQLLLCRRALPLSARVRGPRAGVRWLPGAAAAAEAAAGVAVAGGVRRGSVRGGARLGELAAQVRDLRSQPPCLQPACRVRGLSSGYGHWRFVSLCVVHWTTHKPFIPYELGNSYGIRVSSKARALRWAGCGRRERGVAQRPHALGVPHISLDVADYSIYDFPRGCWVCRVCILGLASGSAAGDVAEAPPGDSIQLRSVRSPPVSTFAPLPPPLPSLGALSSRAAAPPGIGVAGAAGEDCVPFPPGCPPDAEPCRN